jgi:hypothetical protein
MVAIDPFILIIIKPVRFAILIYVKSYSHTTYRSPHSHFSVTNTANSCTEISIILILKIIVILR